MKNVIVLFFLFCVSRANSLIFPIPNFLSLITAIVLVILVVVKRKTFPRIMFVPLTILFLLIIYHKIVQGSYFWEAFMAILIGSAAIAILKDEFLPTLTDYIYRLAVISLVFFTVEVLFFYQLYGVMQFIERLLRLDPIKYDGQYYANIFVFTINHTDSFRNCGFMFEPGPYSCILDVAIFFEIIYSKFKINKRIVVMVIALMTTLSTTGYLGFIVIVAFFLINRNANNAEKKFSRKRAAAGLPLAIILFAYFTLQLIFLPFVGDKIFNLANVNTYSLNAAISANQGGMSTTLGRFNGMLWNIEQFSTSPLFGIGSTRNKEILRTVGMQVSHFGLTELAANLGLVGVIIMVYFLFKNAAHIKRRYSVKFSGAFAIMFIIFNSGFYLMFEFVYITVLIIFLIDYLPKSRTEVLADAH